MRSLFRSRTFQRSFLRFATVLRNPLLNTLVAVAGSEALYALLHLIFVFPNPGLGFILTGIIPAAVAVPLSYLIYGFVQTIEEKNERLVHARRQIASKNEAITSSITYAKGIQDSMLPTAEKIERWLPQHFVLYKPRDIVSGDFYWFAPLADEDSIIITVVDCTGHGVPGALMSVTGHNLLNDIVLRQVITAPAAILEHLNKGIKQVLQQRASNNNDGMDLALCKIHMKTNEVTFAGANNPLLYQSDGKLNVIKGTPRPIGGVQHRNVASFREHSIKLKKGATLYLFSDGYQDQFGGEQGKKFMRKRFYNLLDDIASKPVEEQHQILEQQLQHWMNQGQESQVDDITVLGAKVGEREQSK